MPDASDLTSGRHNAVQTARMRVREVCDAKIRGVRSATCPDTCRAERPGTEQVIEWLARSTATAARPRDAPRRQVMDVVELTKSAGGFHAKLPRTQQER
jgi:hypothetical protein